MKPHLTIDGKAPSADPPWWVVEFDNVCKGLFVRNGKGFYEELTIVKVLSRSHFPFSIHPTTKEGVTFVEFNLIVLFAPETEMKNLMEIIRLNKKHGAYFQQVPQKEKEYRF
jgi:hypothetical protein